ncbi:MAG: hypothetical protein JWM12_426, partial [Ilumatobacteraceae bacterium]|nr:hypothetical protein [Ilumatobacteraceae bacterium]
MGVNPLAFEDALKASAGRRSDSLAAVFGPAFDDACFVLVVVSFEDTRSALPACHRHLRGVRPGV